MRRLLFFSLIAILTQCTSDDILKGPKEGITSQYFPLDDRHTVTFQVTEIFISDEGFVRDTLSYLLRETISGSFFNELDEEIFIVDRFIKGPGDEEFRFDENWTAQISDFGAIRKEDNKTFIKLKLPPEQDMEWDANALFDDSATIDINGDEIDYFKNWKSEVKELEKEILIGNQLYTNTVDISLADYENILEKRYGREIYASGTGLIFKEVIVLDTQCFNDCSDLTFEEKANVGHIYRQEILN